MGWGDCVDGKVSTQANPPGLGFGKGKKRATNRHGLASCLFPLFWTCLFLFVFLDRLCVGPPAGGGGRPKGLLSLPLPCCQDPKHTHTVHGLPPFLSPSFLRYGGCLLPPFFPICVAWHTHTVSIFYTTQTPAPPTRAWVSSRLFSSLLFSSLPSFLACLVEGRRGGGAEAQVSAKRRCPIPFINAIPPSSFPSPSSSSSSSPLFLWKLL
jgi:hypothetical protein